MSDQVLDLLRVVLQVSYWLAMCGSVFLLTRALFLLWRQISVPAIPWRFQLLEVLESSLQFALAIAWLSLPVLGITHASGYNELLVIHHLSVLVALSLAAICLLFTNRNIQRSLHANRPLRQMTALTWRLALSFGLAAGLGLTLLALPSEIAGNLLRKIVAAQSAHDFPKLLGSVAFAIVLLLLAVNDRWIGNKLQFRFR